MATHNIVAVYQSRLTAERVRDHLMDHGFGADRIRLSADASVTSATTTRSDSQLESEQSNEGFFSWLFGTGVSDDDRSAYRTGLTGERTAVSVLADEDDSSRVEDLLDQFSPIDLHEEAPGRSGAMASTSGATETGYSHAPGAMAPTAVPPVGGARPAATASRMVDERAHRTDDGEEVIPIVEEQLEVGKRATEKRTRIRTHAVEKPVEQQVHLRDERVIVERRPATGTTAAAGLMDGQDRELEIIERHEEPVVAKRAKAVEEVVVRKEQSDRTETVRDTLRRTEVDVDQDGETSRDHLGRDHDHEADVVEERVPVGGGHAPPDNPRPPRNA